MHVHKLTETDRWFLDQGRVDAVSRAHFAVGDEVVACENHHVMLAKFYDGTCPHCGNTQTIPFSQQSMETGRLHSYVGPCPGCGQETSILFTQHGLRSSFLGKCPKCGRELSVEEGFFAEQAQDRSVQRRVNWVQRLVNWVNLFLRIVLGVLVGAVIIKVAVGDGRLDELQRFVETIVPEKNRILLEGLRDFVAFAGVFRQILVRNGTLRKRTVLLLGGMASALSPFLRQAELRSVEAIGRQRLLWRRVGWVFLLAARRTEQLAWIIVNWIKALIAR